MKLSDRTVSIIKSFSSINNGLVLQKGTSRVSVYGPEKSVFGAAEVDEVWPEKIAFWDVTKFLSALSHFGDPDITFMEDRAVIVEKGSSKLRKGSKVTLTYGDPLLIVHSDKSIPALDAKVEFTLFETELASLSKMAGVLGSNQIRFEPENGQVMLSLVRKEEVSSCDRYKIPVADVSDLSDFCFAASVDLWRFFPGDYEVGLGQSAAFLKGDRISYFVAATKDGTYWNE